MNLAIGTTSKKTWHLVGKHHLIAAGSTAIIALVLVAAVSIFRTADSGPTAKAANASGSSAAENLRWSLNLPSMHMAKYAHSLTYYLVGSEAQRDQILAGENGAAGERATNGIADPNATVIIKVVATPDQEAQAQQEISEVWAAYNAEGNDLSVHDLRAK